MLNGKYEASSSHGANGLSKSVSNLSLNTQKEERLIVGVDFGTTYSGLESLLQGSTPVLR